MVFQHRIESALSAHAWNKDKSLLAACPNANYVAIFKNPHPQDQPQTTNQNAPKQWEKVALLKEHDALVTDIAWAPNSNKIVTTSQDRNAYVWTLNETHEWKPELVILRITAAATCVRWSPDELKFAVGSGANVVPICYYESENNFWVSKMIKDHESTILSVKWHPTAPIVATASTDMRCRVVSAFFKNLDKKDAETPWGAPAKFGTILYVFEAQSWVKDVAFSCAGDVLAMAVHNSTLTFVDIAAAAAGNSGETQTLRLSCLPLSQILFLPDGALVGSGHTMDPVLFCRGSSGWGEAGRLQASKEAAKEEGGIAATRKMFQSQVATGTGLSTGVSSGDAATLGTVHQFPTLGLSLFGGLLGGKECEFTTTALDGKIVGWTRTELESAMQRLSL